LLISFNDFYQTPKNLVSEAFSQHTGFRRKGCERGYALQRRASVHWECKNVEAKYYLPIFLSVYSKKFKFA